jgi:hypothetical protein
MTKYARGLGRLASPMLALASLALLTGCISSLTPLFTDAQPLLGHQFRLYFYALNGGKAKAPSQATFRWQKDRYVPAGGEAKEIGELTLYVLDGADLIVQSARRGHPVEYAVARKLADATYLVSAVDEGDADEATRLKICGEGTSCLVKTREDVLTIAHATAAKPNPSGGLAVIVAQP